MLFDLGYMPCAEFVCGNTDASFSSELVGTLRVFVCLAGMQMSGSSRAEFTRQAESRAGHAQPAKGPGPRAKPAQQIEAAQRSLVVPKSPRLGRARDRTQQVPPQE